MKDGLFENFENYAKGHSYANLGWGGTQKFLNSQKSNMRGKLTHALTPGGQFGKTKQEISFFNWGWNYVISSNSKAKELAYLFILFASTHTPSTLGVREAGGYFDPYRTEHYSDKKIIESYSKSFLEVHQRSLETSIPDLYLKGQGEYLDRLKENIDLALNGKLKPKDAMDITAKQWEKISFSHGWDSQKEQWEKLKQSYPDHLINVLL